MTDNNPFRLSRRNFHYAIMQNGQAAFVRINLMPQQVTHLMQILYNQCPNDWKLTCGQIERLFWGYPLSGRSCFLNEEQENGFKALHPEINLTSCDRYNAHVPTMVEPDKIHLIKASDYQKTITSNLCINRETKRFLKPAFSKLNSTVKANIKRAKQAQSRYDDFKSPSNHELQMSQGSCFA